MTAEFPAGLAIHLAGRVRAARRRYRKRLATCHKQMSERAVHALRVETRRVLALLDLIETLHVEDPLRKLKKLFKKRLDVFDDLRDTHVQLRLLKPMWRQFPEAGVFRQFLNRSERQMVSKLARQLQRTKSGGLNRRLKELEKRLCPRAAIKSRESDRAAARRALQKSFDDVVRLRRQVRRSDLKTIHRMRVTFKRFRYMCELLQPFLPGLTQQRVARMKEYQAKAGDIQDLVVLLTRVARLVKEKELELAVIANLRRELLRRKRKAIDSFVARIDELFDFCPNDSDALSRTGFSQ